MKTAIKLVLIYFVMQILAALLVMPFAMLYSYAVSGTIDAASVIALAPSMLLGFVGMGCYLWKKGYLKDDGRIWSPVSVAYLGWSIIIGLSTIFLIDFVMSRLSFLPDWSYIRCVAIGLAGHYLYLGVRACLGRDVVSGGDYKSIVAKVQSGEGYYPFRPYFRNFPY